MYELISIVFIIFGVLQIILFFKLWGMTNDIREIKNKYLNSENQTTQDVDHIYNVPTKEANNHYTESKIQPGDLVVLKTTGKQMRVKDVIDGRFSCYSQGGMTHDGIFNESEIKLFEN